MCNNICVGTKDGVVFFFNDNFFFLHALKCPTTVYFSSINFSDRYYRTREIFQKKIHSPKYFLSVRRIRHALKKKKYIKSSRWNYLANARVWIPCGFIQNRWWFIVFFINELIEIKKTIRLIFNRFSKYKYFKLITPKTKS